MSRYIDYRCDGRVLEWLEKMRLETGLNSWTETLNFIITEHRKFRESGFDVNQVLGLVSASLKSIKEKK